MRAKATDAVVGGSSRRESMYEQEKVEKNAGKCKFHGNEGDDGIGTTFVNGFPEEKDHPPRVSDEQENEPLAVVVEVAPSLGVLEKSDEPVLQPMMPVPPPVSSIVQNETQTTQPTDDREGKGDKMTGTFDYAVNGDKDYLPNVSDEQEDEPLLMVAEVSPCLDVLAASEQEWLNEPVMQVPVPLHEKQTPPQTDDAKVADREAMFITLDDGQLGWVEKQLVTVAEELMQTAGGPLEPVDDGSFVSITASEYATKTLHFSPVSELEDAFMRFTLQSDRNCRTPSTTHEVHRSLPVLTPSPTNPLPLQLYHNASLERSGPSQQISAHVKQTIPNNDKIHVTPSKSHEAKSSVIPQPRVERGSAACKHRHGTCHDLPLGIMAGTFTPTSSPKFALNQTTRSMGSEPKHAPTSSKRKPKKDVSLSSPLKRQKLVNLFETKSTVWGAGIQLYNGRSVDRISTVKKCTNKFCIWEPRIHAQRAACERCWALASVAERSEFIANGRHLRIVIVRGGCPRSCTLFTPEERKHNAGTSHEEAIRLCRRCFSDMHYVGIR